MFNTFGKLFCAAALASAALAQSLSIVAPAAKTTLQASSSLVIELEVEQPPSLDNILDVGVAVGFIACPDNVCPGVTQELGYIVYSGSFTPETINADTTRTYENITVTVPNFNRGPMQIGIAHFYLYGTYSIPELNYAITPVTVTGSIG